MSIFRAIIIYFAKRRVWKSQVRTINLENYFCPRLKERDMFSMGHRVTPQTISRQNPREVAIWCYALEGNKAPFLCRFRFPSIIRKFRQDCKFRPLCDMCNVVLGHIQLANELITYLDTGGIQNSAKNGGRRKTEEKMR